MDSMDLILGLVDVGVIGLKGVFLLRTPLCALGLFPFGPLFSIYL